MSFCGLLNTDENKDVTDVLGLSSIRTTNCYQVCASGIVVLIRHRLPHLWLGHEIIISSEANAKRLKLGPFISASGQSIQLSQWPIQTTSRQNSKIILRRYCHYKELRSSHESNKKPHAKLAILNLCYRQDRSMS